LIKPAPYAKKAAHYAPLGSRCTWFSAETIAKRVFFADEYYRTYLGWLKEFEKESGCAIHAYLLMTNHVHLLIMPRTSIGAGDMMKRLGQRYVRCV